jgi:tetratricopeptide (TPR) repeat protein
LRQPALVPLLVFAGYCVARCLTWLRQRRMLPALAVLACAVGGAAWLRPAPDRLIRWTDWAMAGVSYRSVAQGHERSGATAAAREAYVRAVVLNPADDESAARLATLPTPDVAIAPESQRAAVQQCEEARALAEAKNYAAAERVLADAIRLAPEVALPYQYLANVRLLAGDRPGAIDALEQALARAPTNAVFRHNLKALKGFVDG